MKKRLRIILVLMIFCTACGAKELPQEEPADYSGRYTDKQGTAVLTITESDTYLLNVGMVYRFPDGE